MPSNEFMSVEVKGMDRLLAGFKRFPQEIRDALQRGGRDSAQEILETKGLKDYPPKTPANLPPTPYYIRGSGIKYKSYLKPTSEKMRTLWYVKPQGLVTKIGNRASYAKWVHGDEQANAMAKIGWKKLTDVAKDKMPRIKRIYQGWINEAIRKLNL